MRGIDISCGEDAAETGRSVVKINNRPIEEGGAIHSKSEGRVAGIDTRRGDRSDRRSGRQATVEREVEKGAASESFGIGVGGTKRANHDVVGSAPSKRDVEKL